MDVRAIDKGARSPQVLGLDRARGELRDAGFFAPSAFAGGSNWLKWPVALIAGLDEATLRLLATKKVGTIGELVRSRMSWPMEGFSAQGTAAITAAAAAVRAMAAKHNFSLTD